MNKTSVQTKGEDVELKGTSTTNTSHMGPQKLHQTHQTCSVRTSITNQIHHHILKLQKGLDFLLKCDNGGDFYFSRKEIELNGMKPKQGIPASAQVCMFKVGVINNWDNLAKGKTQWLSLDMFNREMRSLEMGLQCCGPSRQTHHHCSSLSSA